ncbi:MAG: hypothetical protein M3N24_03485 [Actinomycetota bacterium]|nr:hypothetical protein [Actinomycetota bacterium]
MAPAAASARRNAMDPRSTRSIPLWAGVLVPPLAWLTQVVVGDLIYELGCAPGMRTKAILGLSLHAWALIQSFVLLAATVGAGLLVFRALGELKRDSDGASHDRAMAMAYVGVASSVLYAVLISFGILPSLVLPQCLPSP